MFKRADLRQFLGIENIKNNLYWYFIAGTDIGKGGGATTPFVRQRNLHDILADLDGAIKIVVQSNRPKAVTLVKWFNKKGAEKVVEEHQQHTAQLK